MPQWFVERLRFDSIRRELYDRPLFVSADDNNGEDVCIFHVGLSYRMNIRKYKHDDHATVISLWNSVFPSSTGHNDPNGAIERKVAADDGLIFVAAEGGAIVGTVLAGYDGHRGWLYSLAVAPEWRRRGIASQLVRHAEEALSQLGCPKLNLQVRADNEEVVAFYESLGFRTEARINMGKLIAE